MSLVFSKPVSDNRAAASLLVIRIGMAFAFFWAGSGKVSNPAGFGMVLQNMAGIDPSMTSSISMMIGVLEIFSGVLILIGFLTRPASIFHVIVLVGAMVMFGFDFTTGPAIWKDPTMLSVAIGLVLYGSGKFGIDNIIAIRIDSRKN